MVFYLNIKEKYLKLPSLKFIILYFYVDNSTKFITRANNELSNFSLETSRLAAGHPEGFFEAFANIYTEFADTINGYRKQKNKKFNFPTVEDGVKGMKFIFAAKKSSNNNARWIKL